MNGQLANAATSKKRLIYAGVMALLFCALVWPVILSGSKREDRIGAEGDQRLYHFPTIVKMAQAWPHPDLNDVGQGQMTPTFHVLMAALMHYCGLGLEGLRLVNSLTGLALVLAVFWYTSKCADAPPAFALCLPYLLSPFMLSCSMWLMTNNLALFFSTIALAGAALFPPTTARVIGTGLAAMAATAVRQISVWLIAPIAAAIICERLRFPARVSTESEKNPPAPQLLLNLGIAVALPVAALLFYFIQWHGLMPPTAQLQGVNNHFMIVPLALAQTAFCCCFLAPATLEGPLIKYLRDWRVWAAAAFCLALAALPHSATPNDPTGAVIASTKTPAILGRVILWLPPAALGGAGLMAFLIAAAERSQARAALIIMVGFGGWLAAHTTPAHALRRYCDIILIMVIWLAAQCLPPGRKPFRFWFGIASLSLVQLATAIYQIYLPVLWGK